MITLKKSLSKWVKVSQDDTVEFLIDYPTIKQGEHLTELKYDAWGKYVEGEDSKFKIDIAKFIKYKKHYLKYVIKDWKGLPEPCVLENNELKDDLWEALTRSEDQLNDLYILISEVEFTEDDKKK